MILQRCSRPLCSSQATDDPTQHRRLPTHPKACTWFDRFRVTRVSYQTFSPPDPPLPGNRPAGPTARRSPAPYGARALRTQQCACVHPPHHQQFPIRTQRPERTPTRNEAGIHSQCSTREQPPTPSFGVWKRPPEHTRYAYRACQCVAP